MFYPQATIRLMKGVPLDNTYRNTFYFDNLTEQRVHFENTYAHITFTNQTYQRYAKNKLRIRESVGNLYEYNYLAFKNNIDYNQKIFYCFITSVEYVSENTTEVTYELDYMQTYFFDYRLGMCFVEREHSETDEIGDNLVPEGLDVGEYVCEPTNTEDNMITQLLPLSICVASTVKENNGEIIDTDGEIYNGIYSGVSLTSFPMTLKGVAEYKTFMSKLTKEAKSEGITSVFTLPTIFTTSEGSSVATVYKKIIYTPENYGVKRSNGKNVKNNKLCTYPYTFLYVTNLEGVGVAFPYEYFDYKPGILNDKALEFHYSGDYSPMCSIIFYPLDYKGVKYNYDEKIEITNYPQLAYNIDTYKAYVAQNAGKISAQTVNTAIDLGRNIIESTGYLYPENNDLDLVDNAKQIITSIGSMRDKMVMPNQAKGGVNTSLAMTALRKKSFQYLYKHIRPEFVDIIDDYFSMYGYATHKVKTPNRNVRPYWTYVKTKGCILLGTTGCPTIAVKNICTIYDNGITFWKHTATVGDYSQDNTI